MHRQSPRQAPSIHAKMSNSAHDHRTAGKRQPRTKREPSMATNLISFLEARGLYQRGRRGIDFRAPKNMLDSKRAA